MRNCFQFVVTVEPILQGVDILRVVKNGSRQDIYCDESQEMAPIPKKIAAF